MPLIPCLCNGPFMFLGRIRCLLHCQGCNQPPLPGFDGGNGGLTDLIGLLRGQGLLTPVLEGRITPQQAVNQLTNASGFRSIT